MKRGQSLSLVVGIFFILVSSIHPNFWILRVGLLKTQFLLPDYKASLV